MVWRGRCNAIDDLSGKSALCTIFIQFLSVCQEQFRNCVIFKRRAGNTAFEAIVLALSIQIDIEEIHYRTGTATP
jgi:hypothetical protein